MEPGYVPKELQSAYAAEDPDQEETFFDWLDVVELKKAQPDRPKRGPASLAPPQDKGGEPSVQETIAKLKALAGPLIKARDAYNKEKLEREDLLSARKELEESALPPRERARVRKTSKGTTFDMPPLLVEGDWGSAPRSTELSRLEPFDYSGLDLEGGIQEPPPAAKPKPGPKDSKPRPKLGQFTDQIFMPGVGDIIDPNQFKPDQTLFGAMKKGWDKIKPDIEITGTNFGKGLAALGDAFMAGGGMKSSFYNNIVKGERLREKQPWERFQTFAKLLNTRVQMEMNDINRQAMINLRKKGLDQSAEQFKEKMEDKKEDRKGRMALARQNIDIKKQQIANDAFHKHLMYTQTETMNEAKLKNYKKSWEKDWYSRQNDRKGIPLVGIELEKMKFDTDNEYYPKWLTDQYKKDPEQVKRMYSVNDLKDVVDRHQKRSLKKLTAKEIRTVEQEMASLKGDRKGKAIIEDVFKKPMDQISRAEFKDFKKHELPGHRTRLKNFVKDNTEAVATAKLFIGNTKNVLKLIGTQIGEPSISRDQIQVDVGRGEIFFVPKDSRGRLNVEGRREIDLDSLTLPGAGNVSWATDYLAGMRGKRSTGSLLASMYEASYGPERRKSFGASQSWMEMNKYRTKIGDNLPANQQEAGKLLYILGLGDAAQVSLTKFGNELRDSFPGGKIHIQDMDLRERGYRDLETNKPIDLYVEPFMAYEFAKKAYNNAKNIEGNLDDNMPHWWRSFKEKVEGKHSEAQQKGSEQGRWYHYEYDQHGRPSKHPDAGEFTDLKNGSGRPPSRWRPKVYLKYIKRYGLNDKGW